MTIEMMNMVSTMISKQEGQKYACSNQIVTCGYFSNYSKWEEFCMRNRDKIIGRTEGTMCSGQTFIKLNNGETWRWFPVSGNYLCRGYRFYKIKVDSTIDERNFMENIFPCCSLYCIEIDWM